MATYNGWTVVTMPATPAPQSIEVTSQNVVGVALNPFTGQQQIQDWRAAWLELSVTMPPMDAATAANWTNFLLSCKGQACVFQLTNAGLAALIPAAANANGYWRLKSNAPKFSVNEGILYGFQFEIREAI